MMPTCMYFSTMDKRKRDKRTNNDLQNITQKTNDQSTSTPTNNTGELTCPRRVSSSCSTRGTRRVSIVTNPVISHEWRKDRIGITTKGTHPGHLLSRFINSIDQIRYAPLFDTPVKNKIMQSITKSIRLWDQQRLCTKMCFVLH